MCLVCSGPGAGEWRRAQQVCGAGAQPSHLPRYWPALQRGARAQGWVSSLIYFQCCGSGMFFPDSNFFIPDPRYEFFPSRILDPHASKNLRLLTQKIISKLSEIWPGLFIPYPDFLPLPDPGSMVQRHPGSGSATLFYFQKFVRLFFIKIWLRDRAKNI